ncbi:helix-turn-helix transcriptional regulator [Pigmentiphaga litoralis]|uniref:helix-turn-helix transcriptional regulator n=1 Tax=Pigmentiphaga litoralis TaxID=516702 RepID=UPI003B434D2E
MSRSRFSARFRELVGESPISYLASRRMGIAAERLALGYLRISDVAEEAGYGSDKVFARAFRRWCGMTPTEYLKSRGVERLGE